MEQIKKLLVAIVVLSVLIAGGLGLTIVLELVSAQTAVETMVKTLSIFAIVGAVSAILIGILQLNKNTDQDTQG